jgi:hypothetical protein
MRVTLVGSSLDNRVQCLKGISSVILSQLYHNTSYHRGRTGAKKFHWIEATVKLHLVSRYDDSTGLSPRSFRRTEEKERRSRDQSNWISFPHKCQVNI